MKKTLLVAGLAALLGTTAMAQDIGFSVAKFDDNFLTVMRNGLTDYAATLPGVNVQVEDAQGALLVGQEDLGRPRYHERARRSGF